jgi:hypothetical protein
MQENEIILRHGTQDLPSRVRQLLDQSFEEIDDSVAGTARHIRLVLYEARGDIPLECWPNLFINQRLVVKGKNQFATVLGRGLTGWFVCGSSVSTAAEQHRQGEYNKLCSTHDASEMRVCIYR